nr:single-stranded DNA-binding protein [uncultured Porphyromonas sp.]
MSSSPTPINQVILTGVVTDSPRVHYLAPGYPEVRLRLETRELITQREGGQLYEQRAWHRIVLRGTPGIYVEQHVAMGDTIAVAGRIEYGRETDKAGFSQPTTEIICQHVQLQQRAPVQPAATAATSPSEEVALDLSAYSPSPDEDPLI